MSQPREGLTIRVDESADTSTKAVIDAQTRELYDLGLFRDDDLTVRRVLIAAHAPAGGLFVDGNAKIANSVRRSLDWATVLEVGVRCLFFDVAPDDRRGPIDAFGALCRVTHGLAERPDMVHDPVVDRLLATVAALEISVAASTDLSQRLAGFVEFSRAGSWKDAPWTATDVANCLRTHPNTLTAEFASRLATVTSDIGRRMDIATNCTAAQYLAFDLLAFLSHSHGKRLVTPTALAGASPADSSVGALVTVMHTQMLDAAQVLWNMTEDGDILRSSGVVTEYLDATFKAVAVADEQLRAELST